MEDNIADSLNFKVSLFNSKLDEEEEDLEKDDFELIDGDVTTQMVDNVPDIQFSDKYVRCSIRACPGEDTNAQSVVDPRVTQQPTSTSLNIHVGMKLGPGGVSMAINSGIKGALIVA
ncbi:hypothetical protein GOBAR_DD03274 [Gossypium barbadense]|nr:hypothetical protein GOBAR_DD03274 [Gossypium barbadense]